MKKSSKQSVHKTVLENNLVWDLTNITKYIFKTNKKKDTNHKIFNFNLNHKNYQYKKCNTTVAYQNLKSL